MVASEKKCRCCGQKRGWIYRGPVYAEPDLEEALCPSCIADGSAHEKFAASFVDSEAFAAEAPASVVEEISQRTPGFRSFQPERWPSCCSEPGAFITPAGITQIRQHYPTLEGELMNYVIYDLGMSGSAARRMIASLKRDGSPAAYVFRCHRCARHLGYIDHV